MRAWVAKNVNTDVADKLRILYGGSGAGSNLLFQHGLLG